MYIRIQIAAMVYLMVQSIMFGAGILLVLATPLNAMAMQLIPWVVGVTAILSLPISWWIAPGFALATGGRRESSRILYPARFEIPRGKFNRGEPSSHRNARRFDAAIQRSPQLQDCFATLAMTGGDSSTTRKSSDLA